MNFKNCFIFLIIVLFCGNGIVWGAATPEGLQEIKKWGNHQEAVEGHCYWALVDNSAFRYYFFAVKDPKDSSLCHGVYSRKAPEGWVLPPVKVPVLEAEGLEVVKDFPDPVLQQQPDIKKASFASLAFYNASRVVVPAGLMIAVDKVADYTNLHQKTAWSEEITAAAKGAFLGGSAYYLMNPDKDVKSAAFTALAGAVGYGIFDHFLGDKTLYNLYQARKNCGNIESIIS